jgi:hypothetical protein
MKERCPSFPQAALHSAKKDVTIAVIRHGRIHEAWNMIDMGHLFETLRGDSSQF